MCAVDFECSRERQFKVINETYLGCGAPNVGRSGSDRHVGYAPDMLRLTKMFFVFGLFVGNRFQNFQMMIRGLRDGFRGRAGPLRPI